MLVARIILVLCNFVVHPKIGKKKPLIGLWGWSILRQCGGLAQIRFVGSLQGIEVLKLEDIIVLSILLLLFPSMENDMAVKSSSTGGFLFLVCFLR